jgi:hypothetical protein
LGAFFSIFWSQTLAKITLSKGCLKMQQGDQIWQFFANWATFGGSFLFFEMMK